MNGHSFSLKHLFSMFLLILVLGCGTTQSNISDSNVSKLSSPDCSQMLKGRKYKKIQWPKAIVGAMDHQGKSQCYLSIDKSVEKALVSAMKKCRKNNPNPKTECIIYAKNDSPEYWVKSTKINARNNNKKANSGKVWSGIASFFGFFASAVGGFSKAYSDINHGTNFLERDLERTRAEIALQKAKKQANGRKPPRQVFNNSNQANQSEGKKQLYSKTFDQGNMNRQDKPNSRSVNGSYITHIPENFLKSY